MTERPVLEALETDRLVLRRRSVDEAGVHRRLWTERGARGPAHRRIDAAGRPSVEDIAAQLREEHEGPGPGLLAVVRKDAGDVIGYCGLVASDSGAPGEPELAFELLRQAHGLGCATEAGGAVLAWADEAAYERLWATVRAWNLASFPVLAKLGFGESGQVEVDPAHGDSVLMVRPFSSPSRWSGRAVTRDPCRCPA